MWRIVSLVLACSMVWAIVAARRADACCVGCPCTKYKRELRVVQEIAPGYIHSLPGGLPRWSVARITKFLTTGTWTPSEASLPKDSPTMPSARPGVIVQPAPVIAFITADQAGKKKQAINAQPVLIRRIEKHGRAILVEVDDRTFKLAP